MKRINYSLFGCEAGGLVRSCNDCPEDEPNRIVHVAFVRKGAVLNKTAGGIIASVLALETTCDAFVVRNINGTMADASYQTGKGYGKQVNRVTSGTHSISISDPDIINNIEFFWNRAISSGRNYNMVFFTSNYGWVVEKPLSISPSSPISDDITSFIEGMVKIDWSDKGLPVPLKIGEVEVDKLEDCPYLFLNVVGFVSGTGNIAIVSTDGMTLSAKSGDAFVLSFAAGLPLEKVEVVDGVLPTGLVLKLAPTGTSILLTGSTTVLGTKTITFRASNACGVGSEFTLKLIIG